MDRRGFMAGILAACAAPAIVRADSLMLIVPRDTVLLSPSAVTSDIAVFTPNMLTEEALKALEAHLRFMDSQVFGVLKKLPRTLRAELVN